MYTAWSLLGGQSICSQSHETVGEELRHSQQTMQESGGQEEGGAALLRAGSCSLSWLSQVLSAWKSFLSSLGLLPLLSTEGSGERTCLALIVHLPVEVHEVYRPCACLNWGAQGGGDWSMVTPPIPGMQMSSMAPELEN